MMVHICNNDKWVLARSLKDMSSISHAYKNAEAQKKENSTTYSVKVKNHFVKTFQLCGKTCKLKSYIL